MNREELQEEIRFLYRLFIKKNLYSLKQCFAEQSDRFSYLLSGKSRSLFREKRRTGREKIKVQKEKAAQRLFLFGRVFEED